MDVKKEVVGEVKLEPVAGDPKPNLKIEPLFKTHVSEEILLKARKICDQLKPLSFLERVRFDIRDVYEENLKLLETIPFELLKSVRCEMKEDPSLEIPIFPQNGIMINKPESDLDYLETENITISEILHYLRCDHIHPNDEVENAYVALYKEFKYGSPGMITNSDLKPLVDQVTRAKEWCWLINQKLELLLHLKSPLVAMDFFEQCCDYISNSVRITGIRSNAHFDEMKKCLGSIKDNLKQCHFLTPVGSKAALKSCTLTEFYCRVMAAVEESRIEFNDRQRRFHRDPSGTSLSLTLPLLENKFLLAVRIYQSRKLYEEQTTLPSDEDIRSLEAKLENSKEVEDLTDFIEKKEASTSNDLQKRILEAEKSLSFEDTAYTRKLQEKKDELARKISNLQELKKAKSESSASDKKSGKKLDTSVRSLRSGNRISSAPSSPHPSSPKPSTSSQIPQKTNSYSRKLNRNDADFAKPSTIGDFKERKNELETELKLIEENLKRVGDEKKELEKRIEEKKHSNLRLRTPKQNPVTSSIKEEIDLTVEDRDLLITLENSYQSSHGSRRKESRSTGNRTSESSSDSVITLD